MTILNPIPVLFDQERHTYTNTQTGDELNGITSTLIHRLFPAKYSGIPQTILERAAQRGTMVHEEIELIETIGIQPNSKEGRNYLRLKEEHGLRLLRSEHTVSDLIHYATNIDAIYEVEENVVDIADFKTTSKLDRESVAWQLSIGAHFLELNNQHVKVRKLLAIWLRDDVAAVIEVERRTAEEVNALIEADQKGAAFDIAKTYGDLPQKVYDVQQYLAMLDADVKAKTEELRQIKDGLCQMMLDRGIKQFSTPVMQLTTVTPAPKKTFDAKKFQQEHPDLYEHYIRESEVKPSVKITFKQ